LILIFCSPSARPSVFINATLFWSKGFRLKLRLACPTPLRGSLRRSRRLQSELFFVCLEAELPLALRASGLLFGMTPGIHALRHYAAGYAVRAAPAAQCPKSNQKG
jgi:hypothetical protein